MIEADFIIVGTGAGGLVAALHASEHGKVVMITKRGALDSNSNWAQGGIACVTAENDSIEKHVSDTLIAGAGLCKEAAVRTIVSEGPARIADLVKWGVHFDQREAVDGHLEFDLTREGGHTARRVLHAADATGRDEASGDVHTFRSDRVILATGGCGRVYLYTTNPRVATGDGVAMAWRAGATISDMEFIQFHPTCLYHPQKRSFLISEAMRGEGARLIGKDGQEFMQRYDPRGSLAPRDIVARAIDHEIKKTGGPCVYLDISHRSPEFIASHFPNIQKACLDVGIDITKEPIPVVPAAHYQCGGVLTDVNGATSVRGLCAVGEVGCTGLHGANRLASNSLLEALLECCVTAQRAVAYLIKKIPQGKVAEQSYELRAWETSGVVENDELVVIYHNWDEIRRLMWDYVSIVRTNKRLQRAAARLRNLKREVQEFYWSNHVTSEILELRNLVETASLIVECAIRRHESRGLHYTLDYPQTDDTRPPQDSTLRRY